MSDIKIKSKNLNVYYGDKQALFDVNLDLNEKEVTALIGPSGCGKSTFIRCINRMNDVIDICRVEGNIEIDGVEVNDKELDVVSLRERVGMVFQKPNPFPKSIYDNISYGPKIHGKGETKGELDEIVENSLKKAALCDMSSPVQGTVRKFVPSGEMTLKKSVIMSEDLLDLLSSDRLIQISLKKTDYHHVHSPVNGQVKEVSGLEKDEFFPGSEAMVIITIGTGFGDVKVVCIGEWSVQTFLSHVEAGDHVDKMTQLGFFYFGSQVIVAFPLCVEIIVNDNAKQRVFPGDPIGICDERVHNI